MAHGIVETGISFPNASIQKTNATLRETGNFPVLIATNNIERFRIGNLGQLGIDGANYGTLGQILTSGGNATKPSWSNFVGLGINQTWQNLLSSRVNNTWYQNTTGRPIFIFVRHSPADGQLFVNTIASDTGRIAVGTSNGASGTNDMHKTIVPNSYYYKSSGSSLNTWAELR